MLQVELYHLFLVAGLNLLAALLYLLKARLQSLVLVMELILNLAVDALLRLFVGVQNLLALGVLGFVAVDWPL